jgi:iron complex outermembrane receptor protein
MSMRFAALSSVCVATLALSPAAFALEAAPIVVDAPELTTVPTAEQAKQIIRRTPGGVDSVAASEFLDTHAVSLHDMLAFSPGVFSQDRWGEEQRLAIRGSGIGRSFHLRGVTLLIDGAPVNTADGSGDFQEIDPLLISHLDVYRGANALRFGSSSLGGAINAVTPSARTLGDGFRMRLEGGSFGTWRGHATGAYVGDRSDLLLAVTGSGADGYREQSGQFKVRLTANYGYRLSDAAETRLYLTLNHLDQEVPGTITLQQVKDTPRSAPAINKLNDYQRNIRSIRALNRTVVSLGGQSSLELGGFVNAKSLYHPIFQVIDYESFDWGGFARLTGHSGIVDWTLGAQAQIGTVDARQYVNVRGNRGALAARGDLKANTIAAYGEARLALAEGLTAIGGLQFTSGRRSADDVRNPARSDSRTWNAVSPKLGLLFEPAEALQFYANVSRAAEVPTFSEVIQGTVQQFVPLDMQRSWTAEIGSRGTAGRLSWDVSFYRAWVRGELLGYTVNPDIPASTFNADKTLHQGVEAALDLRISENLRVRQIYNYNDFRFRKDSVYGDNRLPVVPRHQLRSELAVSIGRFGLTPSVEWIPQGAWADYANTTRVGYAVANLGATARVNDRLSLFVDARNLFGKKGVADISAPVTTAPGSAIYYPLDGRAVYGGVRFGL